MAMYKRSRRDYVRQTQLVVRAGLEHGMFRFQVQQLNHSATLSSMQQDVIYKLREKDRPEKLELHVLLFAISVWVL